jgi:CDP-paratose 2-epimerase
MRILITGACGFAGSVIARELLEYREDLELVGLDNLSRPGAEINRRVLQRAGVRIIHGDVRCASDFESLEHVDWVIDAAANASVLAGINGQSSSRQVFEHNLCGTVNMLELCRRCGSAFTLLSSSRVYSIAALTGLEMESEGQRYVPNPTHAFPVGVTSSGIAEMCSTAPPVSLYGSTKLASEVLALEYGLTYDFPVWVDRCGVMAGVGQFGRPDQGIIAFWVHSHAERRPLRYIGFEGRGTQVMDVLHPKDMVPVLISQIENRSVEKPRICNFGGCVDNSISLAELTEWCDARFGVHEVEGSSDTRTFDLPWVVMDSKSAREVWDWVPQTPIEDILDEVAKHAESHGDWLEVSGGGVR